MPFLIDADWAIEVLRGRPDAVTALERLRGGGIAICRVTIAEVDEGAFSSSNPEAKLNEMRRFFSPFPKLDLDDAVAVCFAELRAYLRRHGEMISELDLIVASTALTHDLTLLSFNRRHFDRVPELKLYRMT
jgi:tRNA(fMet)-specific endonuclease VapC